MIGPVVRLRGKVFACYHLKGGVGKTATAINLAYLSACEGALTLLWDLDPQGATSFYLGAKPKVRGGVKRLLRKRNDPFRAVQATRYERLHLLPADFRMRLVDTLLMGKKNPTRRLSRVLKPLRKLYDRIYLDCAPGIGLLSEAIFEAADVLVVPSIPTTLSLNSLEQIRKHLGKRRHAPHFWPFLSMVDGRKKLHREICASAGSLPYDFLDARIPYASDVERMGVQRAPVPVFAGSSAAATAYRRLSRELHSRAEGK